MADIAAADVTYTQQSAHIGESGLREFVFKVVFGNGSLTYPSGGVPLTKAKMGCPNVIKSLKIFDSNDADGVSYKYDFENNKIRLYQAPAQTHDHDLKIIGGGTIVADGAFGIDASDQFVKVEAGNDTITGADSATKGGVLSETLAAASLAEYGNVAVTATTLYVEVRGW